MKRDVTVTVADTGAAGTLRINKGATKAAASTDMRVTGRVRIVPTSEESLVPSTRDASHPPTRCLLARRVPWTDAWADGMPAKSLVHHREQRGRRR